MTDPNTETNPHADQRLRTDPIVWFGSTRPDGRPHLVPVWFLWDGGTMLVFTKAGSQKVKNLRANPSVTLALDGTGDGDDIVIVEGEAELLAEPTAAVVTPAYIEKYSPMMAQMGMTAEGMAAEYAQPIRVRPTKVIAW
ncbi:MAG: pyridoxamine 5'-phosphate oxidase family protein [Chloroflexia bacterium]|nr:pyridoxamine 5'-phosphate oxidase family protein [Chloroflexia bacterium]